MLLQARLESQATVSCAGNKSRPDEAAAGEKTSNIGACKPPFLTSIPHPCSNGPLSPQFPASDRPFSSRCLWQVRRDPRLRNRFRRACTFRFKTGGKDPLWQIRPPSGEPGRKFRNPLQRVTRTRNPFRKFGGQTETRRSETEQHTTIDDAAKILLRIVCVFLTGSIVPMPVMNDAALKRSRTTIGNG